MPDAELTAIVYWNRRGGALSTTIKELAALQAKRPHLNLRFSISNQNEIANDLARASPHVKLFQTFSSGLSAVFGLPRLLKQLRRLVDEWKEENVTTVVVLMPHIWTPVLGYYVRKAGMKYAIMVHDADPHLGDATAILNFWLHIDIKRADLVYTFSRSVSEKLVRKRQVAATQLVELFLPLISYPDSRTSRPHVPLRVLFLGRILAYKGLPILIGAIEHLYAKNNPVDFGVAGDGDISDLMPRLSALGAEVINCWMTNKTVDDLLFRYDVVVLPYVQASQSGVIMNAFGVGLPVIVTPVGGLPEQIEHGITGLVANAPDAIAIAECIQQFRDPIFYRKIVSAIEDRQRDFSVEVFCEKMLAGIAKVRRLDRRSRQSDRASLN